MKELKGHYTWERLGKDKIIVYPSICSFLRSEMKIWVLDHEKVDVELQNSDLRCPYERTDGYITMSQATIKKQDDGFALYGQIVERGGSNPYL